MKRTIKNVSLLIGATSLTLFGSFALINTANQRPIEVKAEEQTTMKVSWTQWNDGWYFYFPMNITTDYSSSNTDYSDANEKTRILEVLDWDKVELRKNGAVVDNTAFKVDGSFVTRNDGTYAQSFGFKLKSGDDSWKAIFDCITLKEGFKVPTYDYIKNGGTATYYQIENAQSFGFSTSALAGGKRYFPVDLTKIDRFYIGNSTYWFAHLTATTDFVDNKTTASGRVARFNFLDTITFDGQVDPVQYAFYRNSTAYPHTFGSKWGEDSSSTGTNKVVIPGGTVIPSYGYAVNENTSGMYGYYVTETATCIRNAYASADYFGIVEVVNEFIDNNLHMNENVPGQCTGYWPDTVAAYEAMNSGSRQLFIDGSNDKTVTFTAAKDRFVAWAAANDYQVENYALISSSTSSSLMTFDINTGIIIIGVTSMMICFSIIWVITKKKKA